MSFNIKVDKELSSYLNKRKIRFDELVVIVCFSLGKLDLLKDYLHGKNPDQHTAYLQSLERKMLLKKITPLVDFDWDNYELTDAADEIFDECVNSITEGDLTAILEDMGVNPLAKEVVSKEVSEDDFLESFITLFPEGVRNSSGEYLRTNKTDIATKMRSFLKRYKYDMPTVLGATRKYLNKQAVNNYAYCNAAHYFISKSGISKLATECESLIRDGREDGSDWSQNLM